MLTQILLGLITILLGIIAFFGKRYISTNDAKHQETNRRIDIVREEHDNDIDKITKVLNSCSSQVNKLVGTVNTYVDSTNQNILRFEKHIANLYHYKDELQKELYYIKNKAGIEARDSETRAFKKNHINVECLLVDDQDEVRQSMAELIRQELGFNVTAVSNLKDAYKELDNRSYDCAVVDYYLKGELGTSFFDECLKKSKLLKHNNGSDPEVMAVIYTGKDDAMIPAGIRSLKKPFKWSKMRKIMECILTE